MLLSFTISVTQHGSSSDNRNVVLLSLLPTTTNQRSALANTLLCGERARGA
jgi:hypothetical protein